MGVEHSCLKNGGVKLELHLQKKIIQKTLMDFELQNVNRTIL